MANDRGGDEKRQLAEVFHFLLSDDASAPSPDNPPCWAAAPDTDDLHRLLSAARQDQGPDVDLRQRLFGASGDQAAADRKGFGASQEVKIILDANRLVRCVSAGARRLLALGPETGGQIFNYFFQPGQPLLIHIERPDRTVGVGRLLAVNTRWKGKPAYLLTVRDVTLHERSRVAA